MQLSKVEMILRHLEQAQLGLASIGEDAEALAGVHAKTVKTRDRLASIAQDRIEPRKRFPKIIRPEGASVPEYFLFLDECGAHEKVAATSSFPVFCLSGVVIPKDAYDAIDRRWREWKALNLQGPDTIVHEPDVRTCSGPFYRSTAEGKDRLWQSLEEILADLDFTCIATVVDMRELAASFPQGKVDDFLPQACYLMCIDFILERFLHYLHYVGNGATGSVVAERRGLVEDAKVHAEFIRLHLEGTQYIADSEFRSLLRPYIEFLPKRLNNTGLQLADLAARPFADKVLGRIAHPARWKIFETKLYDGQQGRPFSYGLKVFPLSESNQTIFRGKS